MIDRTNYTWIVINENNQETPSQQSSKMGPSEGPKIIRTQGSLSDARFDFCTMIFSKMGLSEGPKIIRTQGSLSDARFDCLHHDIPRSHCLQRFSYAHSHASRVSQRPHISRGVGLSQEATLPTIHPHELRKASWKRKTKQWTGGRLGKGDEGIFHVFHLGQKYCAKHISLLEGYHG